MLRPMANLFAVADPEPEFLATVETGLRDAGEFEVVWRPAPGWVAAQAPLPESRADDEAIRSLGFSFVEGRDRLEHGDDLRWLDRAADLVDQSPRLLGQLHGDFTFVRFRPNGTASAVRSCAGLAPLYLHRRAGGGLALGTLLNYFSRFLPLRFLPDPLINACWADSETFIDGRTFVEDVSILPRATCTELRMDASPRAERYWDPRPNAESELEATPEHARELRRLLIETLERDLDPRGRNLLTLSGGVDSCSVGALAAGIVGRGVSSWSLIPPYEPERSLELSYIEPLVSRFGIEPAHKCPVTDQVRRRWEAETPGLPFPIIHPALLELPRISAQQDVRVLVGGEFADEVCGHWVRITDWSRSTPLRTLLAHPRALPFGPRDYLRWARRRALDGVGRPIMASSKRLPRWARPEVESEYRDWRRRRQVACARDPRPLKELAEHVAGDAWVDMNWEGTTPLGIRRSTPFFNRELLELAFRCHPRELLGPGPKRLLREALGQDVPAHNLFRGDKAQWGGRERAKASTLDAEIPANAGPLVRPQWLPLPPPDAEPSEVSSLRLALRVAAYLEAAAPKDPNLR